MSQQGGAGGRPAVHGGVQGGEHVLPIQGLIGAASGQRYQLGNAQRSLLA